MFFGGDTGHRLEPVGKVGGAFFNSPVFHGIGDHIGHRRFQVFTQFHGPMQRFIRIFWQTFLHDLVIKDHAAKKFRNIF